MSDYPLSLPRDLGPFVIFQYPQTALGAPFLRQYIPQRSEKLKGTLRIDFPIKVAPFSMIDGFIWTMSPLFHVKVGGQVT
jgi:hypothetical protein